MGALFRPQEYGLPDTVTTWRRILGMKSTVTVYPFFIHCFFMSLFASIIGPLVVSLLPDSKERSRSRILETLFLGMVASWTGLTASSSWQHSSTSTSTAS